MTGIYSWQWKHKVTKLEASMSTKACPSRWGLWASSYDRREGRDSRLELCSPPFYSMKRGFPGAVTVWGCHKCKAGPVIQNDLMLVPYALSSDRLWTSLQFQILGGSIVLGVVI